MRLLLKLLMFLVVIIAAVFGTSFLLPAQLLLEEKVVLQASPEQVYTLLNNPTQWEKWSPVNKEADPSMIRLYSGPMAGVGARMQWSGDKVGNGQVELTESVAPDMVVYKEYVVEDQTTVEGKFSLAAVDAGTLISWNQKAQFEDNSLARLKGLWLRYRKQKELEGGLQRLKSALENGNSKNAAKRRVALSLGA